MTSRYHRLIESWQIHSRLLAPASRLSTTAWWFILESIHNIDVRIIPFRSINNTLLMHWLVSLKLSNLICVCIRASITVSN